MSTYFLNNIDSHPKNINNPNIMNNQNQNGQSSNPNNNMNIEG